MISVGRATRTAPAASRLVSVKNWPDRLLSADVIGRLSPVRINTSSAFRPAGNVFRPTRPLEMLNPARVFRNIQFPIGLPKIGGSVFPNTPTTFPGQTFTKVSTTGL